MRVAPGDATTYVLRIRNDGDSADTAHLGDGGSHDPYFLDDLDDYHFLQSGPAGCGVLNTRLTGFLNLYQLVFDAGPIEPHSYLDCKLSIARDADSVHDTWTTWGLLVDVNAEHPYQRFVETALLGTLTDVSVQTRTFHFHLDDTGFAHATAELSVRNGGGIVLDPMSVGACEDFAFRPFFTNGSGTGGCGDDSWSPICFDWGYGFLTPEIEPGKTYSCLIELTSVQPYVEPLAFSIGVDFGERSSGDYYVRDTNLENNTAILRLAPAVGDEAALSLTALDSRFSFAVGALMLLFGLSATGRRR